MADRHPDNAVFVSGDGKVSFNENGQKLDSLGNVVWGDRQSLKGANAKLHPKIEARIKEAQAAAAAADAQAATNYAAQQQRNPNAPQVTPAQNPWSNVSSWGGQQGQQGSQWSPTADVLRPFNAQGAPTQRQGTNLFVPTFGTVQPQQQAPAPRYEFPVQGYSNGAPPWQEQPAATNTGQSVVDYVMQLSLPTPNNQQFDPYPAAPAPQPVQQWRQPPGMEYVQQLGLPMPNNQRFDPWR